MNSRRDLRAIVFVLFAVLVAGLALAGCGAPPTAGQAPAAGTEAPSASGGDGSADVLMLGRSVMAGWFAHWGDDGSGRVTREGLTLRYREIEGPDGIARSASEAIGEAPAGSTVFFKFCFVDFTAGDEMSMRAELQRNEGFVDQVVSAAEARGVRLIIGNALPNVASQTNPFLIREHREYNEWLEAVASEHPDTVRVFDEYSVLAGADGALKAEYASSPDDAHPNDAAYDALDQAFFESLERK